MYFGRQGYSLPDAKVKELAPREHELFTKYLKRAEVDAGSVADSFLQCTSEAIESHGFNEKMVKGGTEADDIYAAIEYKFVRLVDAIREKTNMYLELTAPSGSIVSGENTVYWEIGNAYVRNEEIDEEYVNHLTRFEYVETE